MTARELRGVEEEALRAKRDRVVGPFPLKFVGLYVAAVTPGNDEPTACAGPDANADRARPACRRARPARSASQRAARSAPCAKVARLEALCVISTRSPIAREEHGVIADDVAAAHRREADGRRIALAGHALAAVHRAPPRGRAPAPAATTSPMRSAVPDGCVDLVPVMRFDDLDVVTLAPAPAPPCRAA